jgi:hypothetical protein
MMGGHRMVSAAGKKYYRRTELADFASGLVHISLPPAMRNDARVLLHEHSVTRDRVTAPEGGAEPPTYAHDIEAA